MTTPETQSQILQSVTIQHRVIRDAIRKALLSKWLKEGDAAIYLGCSTDEISKLRKSGRLRGGLLGKQWRYHKDDLDKAVLTGREV